jgi:hypothetical protein
MPGAVAMALKLSQVEQSQRAAINGIVDGKGELPQVKPLKRPKEG